MNKTATRKLMSVVAVVLTLCLVLAGCTTIGGTADTAAANGGAAATTGGSVQFIISIALLVVIFYFFLIRPEKKRKKKEQELRSSLGVGDEIVTIGGLVGKIVNITDDDVTFETGEDRVRIQIAKWAISRKTK
jgi:preprotein translocase subunit YajC